MERSKGEKMPVGNPEFKPPEEILFDRQTVAAVDLDMATIQSYALSDHAYAALRDIYQDDPYKLNTIYDVEKRQVDMVGRDFPYLDELRDAIKDTELMGEPEEFAARIVDLNRDPKNKRIKQEFIDTIMVPGALDYLRKLHEVDADWFILTSGREYSQLVKIEILRLIMVDQEIVETEDELSYIVVDSSAHKIDLLSQASIGGELSIDQLASAGLVSNLGPSLRGRTFLRTVLTDDKTKHLTPDSELSFPPGHRSVAVVPILVMRGGGIDKDGQPVEGVRGSDIRQVAKAVGRRPASQ